MTSFQTPENEPLLLWMVQNWSVVAPKMDAAVAKLNKVHEVIIFDVRISRGESLASLDPATVFESGVAVELEGVRNVLMKHPFMYNSGWTKKLATQTKQEVKGMARKTDADSKAKGCLVCFATGDKADQEKTLPDFCMSIAQFFLGDLHKVAEHNLAEHKRSTQRAFEVQREVQLRKLERELISAGLPADAAKSLSDSTAQMTLAPAKSPAVAAPAPATAPAPAAPPQVEDEAVGATAEASPEAALGAASTAPPERERERPVAIE